MRVSIGEEVNLKHDSHSENFLLRWSWFDAVYKSSLKVELSPGLLSSRIAIILNFLLFLPDVQRILTNNKEQVAECESVQEQLCNT